MISGIHISKIMKWCCIILLLHLIIAINMGSLYIASSVPLVWHHLCLTSLYLYCSKSISFVTHSHQSHYSDVIMSASASQITPASYSTVYSGADQGKHQSSASLAVVRGIDRWPVNSSHKGPVTRKMFPFDDVIMGIYYVYFSVYNPYSLTMYS